MSPSPRIPFRGRARHLPMMAVARWASILGHPFVMIALLVAVPAGRRSSATAVQSLLFVGATVVVPLAVLMVRQVRRGRWSNVDASNRSERPVLFVVALAALVGALAWLLWHDPQSFLVGGMRRRGSWPEWTRMRLSFRFT
jgi:hypothetical protein